MTADEFSRKLSKTSDAAGCMAAAIDMTVKTFFAESVDERNWIAAHDQLNDVIRAMRTLSTSIHNALDELRDSRFLEGGYHD